MAIALQNERELDHDLQEYVNKLDKNPNGNLAERLTWSQIQEKYPAQWVGLNDIEYIDNDGISIKSVVVYFVNRSKDELGMLQALDLTTVRYTTPDEVLIGMSGLGQSFYEEGKEEGRLEGKEEGRLEGKEEGKEEVIRKLLDNGCDVQMISSLTGYSKQQIFSMLENK